MKNFNLKEIYSDKYLDIGERIRFIRSINNLSLEKMASKIGISPQYLGNIERGEKKLSIDILIKISNALKINLYDLIGPSIFKNPRPYKHIYLSRLEDILYKLSIKKLEKIYYIIKNI